jgi:hypothetical protein
MDTPVTFTYNSATYHGTLSPVHGSGQPVWHLYVDKFYWGQLIFTDKWVFHSNHKPGLGELAEEFGRVVEAM